MINNMVKNSNGSIHEINQATDAQGLTAYYPGSIQGSMLNNDINDFTGNFLINQGRGTNIQGSMLNNEIDNYTGNLLINQGYGGNIQNSVINNALINFTQDDNNPSDGLRISQGLAPITNSVINNAVINSNHQSTVSGAFSISQNRVDNSCINNLVYGSEDNMLGQFGLTNSQICNVSLFSNDIYLHEGYLSGVNGCWIAIGCNDYQKMITNLTDTNFFCLTIGNHEIFDLRW
ncbi:MAG: hypothetical protein A4E27_00768 [Methanobacterium sp. PtaU1.Bin242]|nr:MAG: hypothetical protein A4E27_00768 [Methanobacterium sp. PtaU1.Bin242]